MDSSNWTVGQCVEALDSLGYWCKARIVQWRFDGDTLIGPNVRPSLTVTTNTSDANVSTCTSDNGCITTDSDCLNGLHNETDPDEVGPGFEVQFDGWNKEWNRIVKSDAEIREVTHTDNNTGKGRRMKEANVSTLKLHKGDVKEVQLEGKNVHATIQCVDPIRNQVMAVVRGDVVTLRMENFKMTQSTEECCTVMEPRNKPKKQKTKHAVDSAICPTPTLLSQTTPVQEMPTQESMYLLPLALGTSFLEIGEVYSFMGAVTVLVSKILYDSANKSQSIVCKVCTFKDDTVTGTEPNCEITCRPDQLFKVAVTLKLGSRMKEAQRKVRNDYMKSSGACFSDNMEYRSLIRKLRLGVLLREACLELLKSRALRKTVTTLFDPMDIAIFGIGDAVSVSLSVENHHEEFVLLDALMGADWDIYSPSSAAPGDHFTYIRAIVVHTNPLKTTFSITKGKSIYPYSVDYRNLAVASLRDAAGTEGSEQSVLESC